MAELKGSIESNELLINVSIASSGPRGPKGEKGERGEKGETGEGIVYGSKAKFAPIERTIPPAGMAYVYADANIIDGIAHPGVKITDGKAYLIDLPFLGDNILKQIDEFLVSTKERELWNNKVRCYANEIDGEINLIFTTE